MRLHCLNKSEASRTWGRVWCSCVYHLHILNPRTASSLRNISSGSIGMRRNDALYRCFETRYRDHFLENKKGRLCQSQPYRTLSTCPNQERQTGALCMRLKLASYSLLHTRRKRSIRIAKKKTASTRSYLVIRLYVEPLSSRGSCIARQCRATAQTCLVARWTRRDVESAWNFRSQWAICRPIESAYN